MASPSDSISKDLVYLYCSSWTRRNTKKLFISWNKKFLEIRKQKYFESLDGHDQAAGAIEILVRDLKVFPIHNADVYI
ncbi:unnamed protein product, partial [Vitis vinifera]|uniref:TPR1-like CTLH-containing domain-containing protein n=1 Tax=Vitis vinifera TaxID=29760 RepID=D7SV20_VITVI